MSSPVISTQPVDANANVGDAVFFSVGVTFAGAANYAWFYYDGKQDIQLVDSGSVYGSTTANLTLLGVQAADSGYRYFCQVLGGDEPVYSLEATLTVADPSGSTNPNAPFFTTLPSSCGAVAGGSVTFTAAARSPDASAPTYQWKKGGIAIPGATGASFTLPSVALADAGNYSVIASNAHGATTSTDVSLLVQAAAPGAGAKPLFLTQPASVVVQPGGTFSFSVSALGAGSYHWITVDDYGSGLGLVDGPTCNGVLTPTLTVDYVDANTAKYYQCVATNAAGESFSLVGVLTVETYPTMVLAPTITTQPQDASCALGSTATFTAAATDPAGTALTYLWLWGSNPISGPGVCGETTATLTLTGVTAQYASEGYRCVVTNAAGLSTSSQTANIVLASSGTGSTGTGTGGTGTGTGGTTSPTAPSPIVATGTGTASLVAWRGISRAAAGGNAGRWLRDGVSVGATPCGPPLIELPFQQWGDRLTGIWKQRFRQPLELWTALAAYSTHPDRSDLYLIKETIPEHVGAGMGVWERWYCPVPQVHYEDESYPYAYQYIATATTLGSFTRSITSRIKMEYFLAQDEAAYPVLEKDEFYTLSTTTLNSSAQGGGVTLFKSGTYDLHVSPGTSFFVSGDPWIVGENSKITTWNDPIKCRATRLVPGPVIADLGKVYQASPAASS